MKESSIIVCVKLDSPVLKARRRKISAAQLGFDFSSPVVAPRAAKVDRDRKTEQGAMGSRGGKVYTDDQGKKRYGEKRTARKYTEEEKQSYWLKKVKGAESSKDGIRASADTGPRTQAQEKTRLVAKIRPWPEMDDESVYVNQLHRQLSLSAKGKTGMPSDAEIKEMAVDLYHKHMEEKDYFDWDDPKVPPLVGPEEERSTRSTHPDAYNLGVFAGGFVAPVKNSEMPEDQFIDFPVHDIEDEDLFERTQWGDIIPAAGTSRRVMAYSIPDMNHVNTGLWAYGLLQMADGKYPVQSVRDDMSSALGGHQELFTGKGLSAEGMLVVDRYRKNMTRVIEEIKTRVPDEDKGLVYLENWADRQTPMQKEQLDREIRKAKVKNKPKVKKPIKAKKVKSSSFDIGAPANSRDEYTERSTFVHDPKQTKMLFRPGGPRSPKQKEYQKRLHEAAILSYHDYHDELVSGHLSTTFKDDRMHNPWYTRKRGAEKLSSTHRSALRKEQMEEYMDEASGMNGLKRVGVNLDAVTEDYAKKLGKTMREHWNKGDFHHMYPKD